MSMARPVQTGGLGRPRIDAENDLQAIHAWLATKSGNRNTQRAYRKEAERMLLWAIIERGKALSDLSVDDCTGYRDWLSMLGRSHPDQWAFTIQQSDWIAPRNTPRFSADWRPFDGALSASSVKHAITILGSLFEWLVRVQYCAFNPWDAVGKTLVVQQEAPDNIELTRVFSVAQWQFLMDHLHGMVQTDHTGRLRFALPFAHATGLRLSELVDAKTGRLYTMPLRDGTGVRWMLKVLGKGGKWRAVPVPDRIIALLRAFLERRGLDADPLANPPDTALIPRVGVTKQSRPAGYTRPFGDCFKMRLTPSMHRERRTTPEPSNELPFIGCDIPVEATWDRRAYLSI
jgi:site-specific recombinase XerD